MIYDCNVFEDLLTCITLWLSVITVVFVQKTIRITSVYQSVLLVVRVTAEVTDKTKLFHFLGSVGYVSMVTYTCIYYDNLHLAVV